MFANESVSSTDPIEYILYGLSSPSSFEPLTALSDNDWDNIAVTAIALGLAPLLHWHLEQTKVNPPLMAIAKLGVTRQAHAKRNEGIAGQLAEILIACRQQAVKVMVLKGALLAPTVYPAAALRPMNDIDLFFHAPDLAKVGPILEGLGYAGKHKEADQGPGVTKHLSTYRRAGNEGATPNPYLSAGGDRMVEPHGSLEESWFGLKVDITPGVWQRAISLSLHDQPAYRLSTNDMVLHLAVHATFHVIMGAAVFVQLYDLGQVLTVWVDELDWGQIITLAQQAQAQPFIYAALYWAKTIFNAPVPGEPLLRLQRQCPPDLVNYIQALDGPAIFRRTQQPPLNTLAQRLQRGLQDRRETARWANSVTAKWKVWQTALAFHKTDTASLFQKRFRAQA
jgi:hypothetical protein